MPTYSVNVDTAPVYRPLGGETACVTQVVTFATGDLDTNDTFNVRKLPVGARVMEIVASFSDMDTSTGLVIDIGDAGDTDRFIDGTTVGQAGGTIRAGNVAGASDTWNTHKATGYTVETVVTGLVQAGATTAAAGTGTISIFYTCE